MTKNRLASESSPYLRQHETNPIWWFPWAPEAFEEARRTNKPIFLSVGYATCHWCHVMEGDSFEHDDVAAILNQHFVSIKVDREERPDVDAIYMAAVQAMTGQGGWPMSLILTPDLKPFWCATFVPRSTFKRVLIQVAELWGSPRRAELVDSAHQITNHLSPQTSLSAPPVDQSRLLNAFINQCKLRFDEQWGGFAHAPKFPPSMALLTLMRSHRRTSDPECLTMVTKTLDEILKGGIHDHLGGGIHRYTTDREWLTPHFEKMLYDNALLAWALTEAIQITRSGEYRWMLERLVGYVERDMTAPEGAFYSAEDADSEKTEGKFYLWTKAQLEAALTPEEFALLCASYDVSDEGNFVVDQRVSQLEEAAGLKEFEHGNILRQTAPVGNRAILDPILKKLLEERQRRERPFLDDKILSCWNGLMIGALAKAGRVLGQREIIAMATRAATFFEQHLWQEGQLLRRYREGVAGISGFHDDYAFMIFGCIELYQATLEQTWLGFATQLQAVLDRAFWDEQGQLYFDSPPDHSDLLYRTRETHDSALPSSNHMTCYNLLRLAVLTADHKLRERAHLMLPSLAREFAKYPLACPFLGLALDYSSDLSPEITVTPAQRGSELVLKIKHFIDQEAYLPNVLINSSDSPGALDGAVQVCYLGQCQLPSSNFSDIQTEIRSMTPLSLGADQ